MLFMAVSNQTSFIFYACGCNLFRYPVDNCRIVLSRPQSVLHEVLCANGINQSLNIAQSIVNLSCCIAFWLITMLSWRSIIGFEKKVWDNSQVSVYVCLSL